MMQRIAEQTRFFCAIAIFTAAIAQVAFDLTEPAISLTATGIAALAMLSPRLLRRVARGNTQP